MIKARLLRVGLVAMPLVFGQAPERDSLTLREAVEIIADYEILHPRVPESTPYWGVTDFERRTMFVFSNGDLAVRRNTAIHEMLHAARRLRGETAATHEQEEIEVIEATERLYNGLFGTER